MPSTVWPWHHRKPLHSSTVTGVGPKRNRGTSFYELTVWSWGRLTRAEVDLGDSTIITEAQDPRRTLSSARKALTLGRNVGNVGRLVRNVGSGPPEPCLN